MEKKPGTPPPVQSEGHSIDRVMVLVRQGPVGKAQGAIRIHKERIVLGSVISADVKLTGEGVSPIHAVIEMNPQAGAGAMENVATIYDLASDTGVYVNGKKTVTQALNQGDAVRLGSFEFRFKVEEMGQQQSAPARTREVGSRKLFLDPEEDLAPLLLEDAVDIQEIFDYRPSIKKSVEVVLSWCGSILDIHHYRQDQKTVTLGDSGAEDFSFIPHLSPKFSFITKQGESATLTLDPKMTGVVQRQGRLENLGGPSGSRQVELGPNDFAKVTLGEMDFYVSFTASPPRLKAQRNSRRDPIFAKMLTGSLLLTFVVLFALSQAKIPDKIEAEQLPDRLATVLYQPEKHSLLYQRIQKQMADEKLAERVEPPKPKPQPTPTKTTKVEIDPSKTPKNTKVPKVMATEKPNPNPTAKPGDKNQKSGQSMAQGQAKEGEGARAKGTEGTRGSKKAPNTAPPQNAAQRPSTSPGTGRGGGLSQVEGTGNVAFLKGAGEKIQDILGASAQKLGASGSKLKGFGGFTTQGEGGLALSGSGTGGGGTAETTLGGLSNKGMGGGRVGTGMGAAGAGQGIIGGKQLVSLRTGGEEETVVMGSIDKDAILAAILAHKDEFRLCYEREINAERQNLQGNIVTAFTIGPSGRVNKAGVQSTTMRYAPVERCVVDVLKRIEFPAPAGGGVVSVTFPFKFRPIGS